VPKLSALLVLSIYIKINPDFQPEMALSDFPKYIKIAKFEIMKIAGFTNVHHFQLIRCFSIKLNLILVLVF